ncbi:MAG: Holliday junction resolvase RuvX [Bacilli bacterium]|jgi:putative Holliday junction resolvase|nr:Holliday junction resolvase RuvX [Acholeplasmataceae bacterium]
MRILGLDLGDKTLGMAVSDSLGLVARPLGTVRFSERDLASALEAARKAVEEHNVQKIVLGLPKHMSGDVGAQAEYCLEFKKLLEKELGLEVIMIDERLTSRMAERVMLEADISRKKRKKNVDKLAATIILQTYLDIHSK